MKKRTKWLVGLAIVILIGGVYMSTEEVFGFGPIFVSKRDRQIAYLKEHEQEIVDFIKLQNPKIESVQIDWNDVRGGKVSNPFSDEEYVSLYGTFNHIEDSGWSVIIYTENGKLDIDTLGMGDHLRIGGEIFE